MISKGVLIDVSQRGSTRKVNIPQACAAVKGVFKQLCQCGRSTKIKFPYRSLPKGRFADLGQVNRIRTVNTSQRTAIIISVIYDACGARGNSPDTFLHFIRRGAVVLRGVTSSDRQEEEEKAAQYMGPSVSFCRHGHG